MSPTDPFFAPLLFIVMVGGVFVVNWLWDTFTKK
jgi:hypothetical protein